MSYNVLLVDDSASLRKVIRKILRTSGFHMNECFEASNGREALQVLSRHWIDLVLTDIHMPEMDGFELLEAISRNEIWRDLPVVLVTTESNPGRQRRAMELGARGYIRKPFRPEELRSLLMRVLGETHESMANGDEGCDF
ncbi:response regulator [Desulfoferrobacter suflitae]|uniref:response regulator n=1 Tax=Desulfoferrobacter suflitae TaxID=2865782 RepID=UPI0021647A67|nr:response regulator [Desulfoferrobacter suflitae]MCK8602398.1 response regulator [Desulfoferrobacter suflitae]